MCTTVQSLPVLPLSTEQIQLGASNFVLLKIKRILEIFASESKNIGPRTEGLFIGPSKKIKGFGAIFFQNHSAWEKTKSWTSLGTYFGPSSAVQTVSSKQQ